MYKKKVEEAFFTIDPENSHIVSQNFTVIEKNKNTMLSHTFTQ